jgi:ATP-binding cassette subfamily B protein
LRVAHARQLALWAEAGLRRQTAIVAAEGVQSALVLAAVVALVWRQAAAEGDPASLLLLAYWAASIPLLGRDLAAVLWSLPAQRNSLLRFLEPLGAPREPSGDAAAEAPAGGVSIGFRGVGVTAGGHAILEAVDLDIGAGEHVGIVGASGAGKSSLLGLLLGWHACAQGRIDIDGIALDLAGVDSLRRRTAWVDPQVHLFRRSLLDNLCFGNGPTAGERVGDAVERAGLAALLARLPAGLRSPLGDAGMLFSGGEGQAVRMARALARPGVRLVLLDEAGRGLDRPGRQRLLAEARQRFAGATLLCVSHDVADTLDLDRVVVVDQGRIVEQGPPRDLQRNPTSRYRHLLDQEAEVADGLWRHAAWRRLRLRGGRLADSAEAGR